MNYKEQQIIRKLSEIQGGYGMGFDIKWKEGIKTLESLRKKGQVEYISEQFGFRYYKLVK